MKWSVTARERQVLEDVVQGVARHIGGGISDAGMEGRVGFCLMVFTWTPGFMTYVSDGDREGVIKALRETADTLERKQIYAPLRES